MVEGTIDATGTFVTVLTPRNLESAMGMVFGSPKFVVPPPEPPEDRWRVIFGEAIQNLRIALDYLVHELDRLDGAASDAAPLTRSATQFPICDGPTQFKSEAKRRLAGLTEFHRQAIERLQPYANSGLDPGWLRTLADHSNPDKHRQLIVVAPRTRTVTTWMIGRKPQVQIEFRAARFISLGDANQTPAVQFLQDMAAHVKETLETFAPEFEI